MNETIFKDVSELGFAGLELFDWQINSLESQGLLAGLVAKYKLPLVSSYTSINLTDPAMRAQTIAAAVSVGTIMKKYGGKTIVIGPSGRVGGPAYNFSEHKQNIVTTLNELGRRSPTSVCVPRCISTPAPPSRRATRPTRRWRRSTRAM